MNWLNEIDNELQRSVPNENPGRTRTIARRAAGIALKKYYNDAENDFLVLLQRVVQDIEFPEDVRRAAERLSTRLNADFQSPSVDPVSDAKNIIEFVKNISHSNRATT